jgi:hypothetical protein
LAGWLQQKMKKKFVVVYPLETARYQSLQSYKNVTIKPLPMGRKALSKEEKRGKNQKYNLRHPDANRLNQSKHYEKLNHKLLAYDPLALLADEASQKQIAHDIEEYECCHPQAPIPLPQNSTPSSPRELGFVREEDGSVVT